MQPAFRNALIKIRSGCQTNVIIFGTGATQCIPSAGAVCASGISKIHILVFISTLIEEMGRKRLTMPESSMFPVVPHNPQKCSDVQTATLDLSNQLAPRICRECPRWSFADNVVICSD